MVLENYAEGVMQKLGLSSATLRAIRPGLVLLSMPAFGAGGPLSGLRAYGSTVEQSSGLPFMNGEAAWAPCLQHVAFGDPVAGLFGAAAILAALASRDRLGGSAIDCSQVECLFQLGADGLIAAQVLPDLPRTGRARARLALCDVVAAAGEDEWLAVAAKPSELRALAGVLGVAEDADLQSALAEWASVRTPMDGAIGLQAAGVAAAPVTPSSGLCQDPHLVATGFWPRMQRAYVGEHSIGHAPFRLDGQRVALRRTAPLLGEHTDEVLAELAAEVT